MTYYMFTSRTCYECALYTIQSFVETPTGNDKNMNIIFKEIRSVIIQMFRYSLYFHTSLSY